MTTTSNRRPRGCRGAWTARRGARRASFDGGLRIATIQNGSPLDFSKNFDARAFVGGDVRSGSTCLSSRPAMPRPMDPLGIPFQRRAEGGGRTMELRRDRPVPRPMQAAPDFDVFPPPAKCGGDNARSEAMPLPTAAVAAVEYPQREGDGTPRDAARIPRAANSHARYATDCRRGRAAPAAGGPWRTTGGWRRRRRGR